MEITKGAGAIMENSLQMGMTLHPVDRGRRTMFSTGRYWREDIAGIERALKWKGVGCLWEIGTEPV